MRNQFVQRTVGICIFAACAIVPSCLQAQDAPEFTAVQRLTNNEVFVTLNAPTGINYRIDVTSSASNWNGLIHLPVSATTSLQVTDSAAPYLDARFYRASELTGSNILAGDILSTTNGDIVIQPRYHASFVMQWNGKMIYSDPAPPATFTGLPKADLILVTHNHGDHYNTSTINSVTNAGCVIIAPQGVYNSMTASLRSNTIVLGYGASTNVMDINVLAVAGYNGNHALNVNNCYVLTIGGKRIFISGDTGDVPEIRALTDIDVAFLCMNVPFTMTAGQATNCIRAMRPKVVYPYHFQDSPSGARTNAATFKQWLGTDLGIEVRLRKWY